MLRSKRNAKPRSCIIIITRPRESVNEPLSSGTLITPQQIKGNNAHAVYTAVSERADESLIIITRCQGNSGPAAAAA